MLRIYLPSILFLALCVPPLSALDESLVGTWEASGEEDGGSFTTSVVFLEDGTFELRWEMRMKGGYQLPPPLFEEREDLTAGDAEAMNQMVRAAWPEVTLETASSLGSGTYTTAGDILAMEWVALDITYDDRDFSDFFVSLWTEFGVNFEAQVRAAEGGEFPEEDRLALEQELTTLYQVVWSTEGILAVINETDETSPTTYDIRDDGESLVLERARLEDPSGWIQDGMPPAKPLVYRRIDVASAVTPATWGGVKSTLAP